MPEPYSKIIVSCHSERPHLYPSVCRYLKDHYGSGIILLTRRREDADLFQGMFPGLFDDTLVYNLYESLFEEVEDPRDLEERAAELERRYGFLFTHLFANDRHLGLGYSPGGINAPRSVWSEAADYHRSLQAFVNAVEMYEMAVQEHGVTMVFNPPLELSVVAAGRGIPERKLMSMRYKNYYYWAENDVLESSLIGDAYQGLEGEDCSLQLTSQYANYLTARKRALKSFKISKMVQNMGYEIARRAYHRLRGYAKARSYLLKDNVRAHFMVRKQYHEAVRYGQTGLDELEGRDFVYFPLGVEPERTLTRDSPEFCHQAYALQAIAKDLPAGMVVAVKEHLTAVGTRPRDFYKGIARMTNVLFLDPHIPGLEVTRKAGLVATITGTTGLEAAILGVPVLSFGKYNMYNMLPHVRYVNSWLEITPAVRELTRDFESGRKRREANGRRFLRAMVDISVDCGETDFKSEVEPELLESIMALLEKTLPQRSAAA